MFNMTYTENYAIKLKKQPTYYFITLEIDYSV